MVAMTVPDLWADPDRLLTVDDLEDLNDLMGDDGRRLELDDGILIVSPAAASIHQLVLTRLMIILVQACPENLVVRPGVGINVSRFQHRIPDVAVVPSDSFGTIYQEEPPALAVEVSSPSTRIYDRNRKKDVYESFGIPAYWIVEPDRDRPGWPRSNCATARTSRWPTSRATSSSPRCIRSRSRSGPRRSFGPVRWNRRHGGPWQPDRRT